MFIEICLMCMDDIKEIPLVISKLPISKGDANAVGISKTEKAGDTICEHMVITLLTLKIEIITENRTTNPPIIKIVEVALVILSANTLPKLEKDILFLFFIVDEVLDKYV
ncbi:MAG: hypothetical protein HFJ17_05395 [Clostridia bacterium]|nr:hypothetical protein [Clostridia bacterium]